MKTKEISDKDKGQRAVLLETMYSTIQTLSWESQKQSTGIMQRLNLTLPQGFVLLTLDALGSRAKMSTLIEMIQISGGTLTGIVDRLIVASLVARERDEADRRVVYVSLTEAGAKKVLEIQHIHRINLENATAGFTTTELEQFIGLLKKFVGTAISPELLEEYALVHRQTEASTTETNPQHATSTTKNDNMSEKDLSGKPS